MTQTRSGRKKATDGESDGIDPAQFADPEDCAHADVSRREAAIERGSVRTICRDCAAVVVKDVSDIEYETERSLGEVMADE